MLLYGVICTEMGIKSLIKVWGYMIYHFNIHIVMCACAIVTLQDVQFKHIMLQLFCCLIQKENSQCSHFP